MNLNFENPKPISHQEFEEAMRCDEPSVAAQALIRMALCERDLSWAELKSLCALNDHRKEVRLAGLVAIGHLARIHHCLNLQAILPAVKKLMGDPLYRGTAEDVLDDIAIFVPQEHGDRPDISR